MENIGFIEFTLKGWNKNVEKTNVKKKKSSNYW